MLQFNDFSLRRGEPLLLENVNLTLHSGQRVGIVGANGVGKSTLFALILGELEPDSGQFSLQAKAMIAHVAQETPALDCAAIDYVLDGDAELRDLQHQLKALESEPDADADSSQHDDANTQQDIAHRIGELHAQLEAISGYSANSRAAQLLNGLGFQPDEIDQPVQSFSGGWRMRLNLAKALMCRSDVLLLDEPTNHLDIEAIIWLEKWLMRYEGTLLLISHDRQFLDNLTTHIVHLHQQQATLYTGNYSSFEQQRSTQLAQQQQAHDKQQREIAHMESFIRRFKAKATKAKQAQSRIKALERMSLIAPAHIDSPFTFQFKQPPSLPSTLLTVKEGKVFIGETELLNKVNLNIGAHTRIGLLGKNGAGKSTLIKSLANSIDAENGSTTPPNSAAADQGQYLTGECSTSKHLNIGYFAQHQLDQLDPNATPLTHFTRLDPKASEQSLRNYLGGFDFGRQSDALVGPFSGGEKARLAMALLIYQKPNLLLLDEPTNHLDLEMRHALTKALQGYEGAFILVSHDRHLLENCCDEFWLVDQQRVSDFEGDLNDYHEWRLAESKASSAANSSGKGATESTATPSPSSSTSASPQTSTNHQTEPPSALNTSSSKREQRQQAAEQRKRLQPLLKKIKALESKIDTLQARHQTIQTALTDSALYEADQRDKLKALLQEEADIKGALEENEEAWLEANEDLESQSD